MLKELRNIPFADDTVGRRKLHISEDLCDQLIDKRKTSRFALQADEPSDVVKLLLLLLLLSHFPYAFFRRRIFLFYLWIL
jgi:hypothetical protein